MKQLKKLLMVACASITVSTATAAEITTMQSGQIYEMEEMEVLTFIIEGTAVDSNDLADSSVGKCSVMIDGVEEYSFAITPERLGSASNWSLAGTFYKGLTPAKQPGSEEPPVMSSSRIGQIEPETPNSGGGEYGYEIVLVPYRYDSATHTFQPMDITDNKITVIAWEKNATVEQQIADLKAELQNFAEQEDLLVVQAINSQIVAMETQLKIINDRLTALENAPVQVSSNDDDVRSWGELAVLPATALVASWGVTHSYDKSAAKRLIDHESTYHRRDTAGGRPPELNKSSSKQTPKPVRTENK